MNERYRPIACSLHDELEALATLRRTCEIRYRPVGHDSGRGAGDAAGRGEGDEAEGSGMGRESAVARGTIRDIYARDGAEYLLLDDGTRHRDPARPDPRGRWAAVPVGPMLILCGSDPGTLDWRGPWPMQPAGP